MHRSRRNFIVLVAFQGIAYALFSLVLLFPAVPAVNGGWLGGLSLTAQTRYHLAVPGTVALPALAQRVLFLLSLCILGGSYAYSLYSTWRSGSRISLRWLLGTTTLLALPLVFLPRLLSNDIYHYAFLGRMMALHGGNPVLQLPSEFATDPWVALLAATDHVSLYGPTWLGLSLPLTWAAEALGGIPWSYLLLYKLCGLGSHLGTMALLWHILLRRGPEVATWGTLVYGWHPLALIEFAGSGHNDSLMVLFIAAAMAALFQRRYRWSIVALVLGGLVKVTAFLLLPLVGLYMLRHEGISWRFAAQQAVLAIGLVMCLYLPFLGSLRQSDRLVDLPQLQGLMNGPVSYVVDKLEFRQCGAPTGANAVERSPQPSCPSRADVRAELTESARLISFGLFACIYLLIVLRPVPSLDELSEHALWILVAACLLFVGLKFEPWYATWGLVFVPLIPRLQIWVLVWSWAVLCLYLPTLTARIPIAYAPLLVWLLVDVRAGGVYRWLWTGWARTARTDV